MSLRFLVTLEEAVAISNGSAQAILSEDARVAMLISRNAIEQILLSNQVVYGINTGFGAMSSVRIDGADLEDLQTNLIRSHACGVGDTMEPEHVLLMMVFRANSLAKGVSGIRPEIVDLLLSMVNSGIAPVVPRIGSLGASGDLAPLSHMSLAMIGEGDCMIRGEDGWSQTSSKDALNQSDLSPIVLGAKEGLSLINGTSQMCAYMTITLLNMDKLAMAADASARVRSRSRSPRHRQTDRQDTETPAARAAPPWTRWGPLSRHIAKCHDRPPPERSRPSGGTFRFAPSATYGRPPPERPRPSPCGPFRLAQCHDRLPPEPAPAATASGLAECERFLDEELLTRGVVFVGGGQFVSWQPRS